jgi:hypothetical protein
MGKILLTLLGIGLGLSLEINAYSQSSKESVPDTIVMQAAKYLIRVNYCPGAPIIEKIGEKFEDRIGPMGVKDGIKDKITLYNLKNDCPWINVPNYIIFTQRGLDNGKFEEKGIIEDITSRDNESWKAIPLAEEW